MTSSASLVGYAILRANFNAGLANYLDNFIPFIVDAVRSMNPKPTDASDVSTRVRDKFGIAIPLLVSRNILKRAHRVGRLREAGLGKYQCTSAELDTGRSVSADFDKFIRQENEIGDRLLAYARSHDLDEGKSLNREECVRLIARYVDMHALPLLKSAVQGAALPARLEAGENYLVSSFVAEAQEQNELLFSQLVEVAKGATNGWPS